MTATDTLRGRGPSLLPAAPHPIPNVHRLAPALARASEPLRPLLPKERRGRWVWWRVLEAVALVVGLGSMLALGLLILAMTGRLH